jgi:Tol biopolymer transport system component
VALGATLALASAPVLGQDGRDATGYLAYELDGDVWVAGWDGGNAERIADGTPSGWHYMSPRWSQDGTTLSVFGHDAASEGPLVMYQADGDGHGLREVARDEYVALPSLSPSGLRRVLYGTSSMTVIGSDGARISIPAPEGFLKWNYWDAPSWTPDGSRIIAGACTTSDCKSASAHELFSTSLTGAAPTRLTPAGVHDYSGSVSPDGSLVAFLTSSEGDWRVGLVGVDGTERRLLDGPVYPSLAMAWSSDSRSLAITSGEGEARAIWIVNIDRSVPMRMLAGTEHVGSVLDFSPDGQWLLASWFDGQEEALWRVEVDGDVREEIVRGSFEGDWQWLPTGAR